MLRVLIIKICMLAKCTRRVWGSRQIARRSRAHLLFPKRDPRSSCWNAPIRFFPTNRKIPQRHPLIFVPQSNQLIMYIISKGTLSLCTLLHTHKQIFSTQMPDATVQAASASTENIITMLCTLESLKAEESRERERETDWLRQYTLCRQSHLHHY